MPLYEFSCRRCASRFEELVRLGQKDAPTCPSCGAADTVRVLSAPADCRAPTPKSFQTASPSSGCGGGGGFS